MTRQQLIDAIIESAEGMVGGMGNDFVSGLSPQETVFQNMLGRIVRKKTMRRKGFINPPIHEEKDYEGMKVHLRAAAAKRGLTGKRKDAYIFGAMRRAGWKPTREEDINETMDVLGRVAKKTGKKVKTAYSQNVLRPVRGTRRALRYKKSAEDMARVGRWGRSIEMSNRANKVLKAHRPALVGAVAGAATGAFVPAPLATEIGAVLGSKGGQMTRKLAKARA